MSSDDDWDHCCSRAWEVGGVVWFGGLRERVGGREPLRWNADRELEGTGGERCQGENAEKGTVPGRSSLRTTVCGRLEGRTGRTLCSTLRGNPELETPNPKPRTLNPELNPEPKPRNHLIRVRVRS